MVHCPNPSCGGGEIETNQIAGIAFSNCCGAIVEENLFVSEITLSKGQSKGKGTKRQRGKEESSSSEEEELEEDEEAAVRTLATMKDIGTDDAVFKKPYPVAGPNSARGVADAERDGEAVIPSFPAKEFESAELEIAQANQDAMQKASQTEDNIAMEKKTEQEIVSFAPAPQDSHECQSCLQTRLAT